MFKRPFFWSKLQEINRIRWLQKANFFELPANVSVDISESGKKSTIYTVISQAYTRNDHFFWTKNLRTWSLPKDDDLQDKLDRPLEEYGKGKHKSSPGRKGFD